MSSHCLSSEGVSNRSGYGFGGCEDDLLDDLLLSDDILLKKENGEHEVPAKLMDYGDPSTGTLSDWEMRTFFPELCAYERRAEEDVRTVYCEYEVNKSEVTHLISLGPGGECNVTQVVHTSTIRWQEAADTCACGCQHEELLSPLRKCEDSSTTTCGFLSRQQGETSRLPETEPSQLHGRPVGNLPGYLGEEFDSSQAIESYCDTTERHHDSKVMQDETLIIDPRCICQECVEKSNVR